MKKQFIAFVLAVAVVFGSIMAWAAWTGDIVKSIGSQSYYTMIIQGSTLLDGETARTNDQYIPTAGYVNNPSGPVVHGGTVTLEWVSVAAGSYGLKFGTTTDLYFFGDTGADDVRRIRVHGDLVPDGNDTYKGAKWDGGKYNLHSEDTIIYTLLEVIDRVKEMNNEAYRLYLDAVREFVPENK